MAELFIRRYQPGDLPAVWELHNKALIGVNAHLGKGKWDDDFKKIESAYLKPRGEFLVGLIKEKIVAMGALKKISKNRAEVKRMRVDPEYQRQGLGQAMLSRLEKRAKELEFQQLQLDTMVKQTAARGLYEKNGYKEFKRGFMEGNECVFYKKILI